MTKQVVAKRSLSEGTVQLEESIWDNGSVTYDVCLIYTSSQATSKNFHSIETIEEACRIYNEYSEELCEVYKSKFRKTQRKEVRNFLRKQKNFWKPGACTGKNGSIICGRTGCTHSERKTACRKICGIFAPGCISATARKSGLSHTRHWRWYSMETGRTGSI